MTAIAAWIVLTITPTGWTLDMNANVVIEADLPEFVAGVAWTPHIALVDPVRNPGTVRHELDHLAQWTALGPAFPIAYALAGGHAFEDYRGGPDMWRPPPDMTRNCPLVRVDSDVGVRLLPCWTSP